MMMAEEIVRFLLGMISFIVLAVLFVSLAFSNRQEIEEEE